MAPLDPEVEDAFKAWGVSFNVLEAWSAGCRNVRSRPCSAAEVAGGTATRGISSSTSAPLLQRKTESATSQLHRSISESRPQSSGSDRRSRARGTLNRQLCVEWPQTFSTNDDGFSDGALFPFEDGLVRPAQAVEQDMHAKPSSSSSRPMRPTSQSGSRTASRQVSRQVSRPVSGASNRPGSRPVSRDGIAKCSSKRFTVEELQCFRRIPVPSSRCEEKEKGYWQSTGALRKHLADDNWNMLPVLKGKFFQHPQLRDNFSTADAEKIVRAREKAKRQQAEKKKAPEAECLPKEALTAEILESIFSRDPRKKPEEQGGSRGRTEDSSHCSALQGSNTPMLDIGAMPRRPQLRTPSASNSPKHSIRDTSGSPPQGRKKGQGQSSGAAPTTRKGTPVSGGQGPITPGGAAGATSTDLSKPTAQPKAAMAAMAELRRKLLERFHTVKDAFDALEKDILELKVMTKTDLARALARYGIEWSSREERDVVFDQLDFKCEGHTTMNEFHIAIEASAPVRSIEDLRRRWLASKFSMYQAIMHMTGNSQVALSERLSFTEFAERLTRANVNEPAEHLALFNAICYDKSRAKVSIAELASAVAVVSPGLLLEDLRDRLNRKYGGDLEKAFQDLDIDHGGTVDMDEFTTRATGRLHMSHGEAAKAFQEVNVGGNGEISREEFMQAIGLSEPSLFLEDLRLKVRQRHFSFRVHLANAFQESRSVDINDEPKLSQSRFQEVMQALDMTPSETKALFGLIDANQDGELTIREFVRGIHHFAPSACLEDLRHRCFQMHSHIVDAFPSSIDDVLKPLDVLGLRRKLLELGLFDENAEIADKDGIGLQLGFRLEDIFDLLDVTNKGEVTLGRLISALQSCGAGSCVRLSPSDLDSRARQDVKGDMAPMHRLVSDIKKRAREGIRYQEDQRTQEEKEAVLDVATGQGANGMLHGAENSGEALNSSKGKGCSKSQGNTPEKKGDPPLEVSGRSPAQPRANKKEDSAGYFQRGARANNPPSKGAQYAQNATVGAQKSWSRLQGNLQVGAGHSRNNLETNLQSYYHQAAMSLSHDGSLIHGSEQSKAQLHESIKAHQQALKPPLRGKASP